MREETGERGMVAATLEASRQKFLMSSQPMQGAQLPPGWWPQLDPEAVVLGLHIHCSNWTTQCPLPQNSAALKMGHKNFQFNKLHSDLA